MRFVIGSEQEYSIQQFVEFLLVSPVYVWQLIEDVLPGEAGALMKLVDDMAE